MSLKYSCSPKLTKILKKTLNEGSPTLDEAYTLINVADEDLHNITTVASIIRDKGKGRRISYSMKVLIPLTNMCQNYCGYCSFRKDPSAPDSKIMMPKDVMQIAELGEKAGCKEALFVLGEKPETKHPKALKQLKRLGYSTIIDYLFDMCEMVVKKTQLLPHSNAGVLTKEELTHLKDVNASMGLMLENVSTRLSREGGPHYYSPGKNPYLRLRTIEEAGELRIPFTTGILIGIGETPKERVDSLFHLKRLHDKYNHIQELIIQNFNAQSHTLMENNPEPSISDIVKTVAVARIIFQSKMNIQTPPNLISESYQELLNAGINDWGGISNITNDLVNPQSPWPEINTLKNITLKAGFQIKMRLPIYPEYIKSIPGFLPKSMKDKILSQVDDEGYAKEK